MKQKGFSLIELLIVVAIILIIAAISIPNLIQSRIAANEVAAVGSLKAINSAEIAYSMAYPATGFTCALSNLGPPVSGSVTSTAAGLIDATLAAGTKAGYTITPGTCNQVGGVTVDYQWKADPNSAGLTGHKYFCTDVSGVVKFHAMSSIACLSSGTPM